MFSGFIKKIVVKEYDTTQQDPALAKKMHRRKDSINRVLMQPCFARPHLVALNAISVPGAFQGKKVRQEGFNLCQRHLINAAHCYKAEPGFCIHCLK
jgi:hypothetical protein